MLPFGGQHDSEYLLRGMKWAGNYCPFSDNKEKLTCMLTDIIEELLDPGHGAQAGTIVDKHTQTGGYEDLACWEQRRLFVKSSTC